MAESFIAELISNHCRKILDRSDAVNTLDLHHRVEIQYPVLSLGENGELPEIQQAVNMQDRYDPVPPLVPDEAVTIHSGLSEPNEVVYASAYPVHYSDDAPKIPTLHRYKSLPNDMEQCLQLAGNTVLEAMTYIRESEIDSPRKKICLRLRRTTIFPHGLASTGLQGTQPIQSQRTYDDRLSAVRRALESIPSPWAAHLAELIDRESDKAVRHVASMHKAQDKDSFRQFRQRERDQWHGLREMDFRAVLDSKAKIINKNDPRVKGQNCAICAEEFGPSALPLELKCHASHVLCNKCLINLCDNAETWLEKIKCPQCREPALSREEMNRLKFGIINGNFYYEEQYTEWENFQRSCADLDKEDVTNKTWELKIDDLHRFIIFDIWLYLFLEDLKGIQDTTLEDRIVMLAVQDQLANLEGRIMPVNKLFEQLHWRVYERLLEAYEAHGWLKYLQPHDVEKLTEAPDWKYFEDYLLRPGYAGVVQRSLKRALRFIFLRECGRRGPGHEGTRHFHGGRAYFDFNAYIVKLRGDLPKLTAWEKAFERGDWEEVYGRGVKREKENLEQVSRSQSVRRMFRIEKDPLTGRRSMRKKKGSKEKRTSNGRMVID